MNFLFSFKTKRKTRKQLPLIGRKRSIYSLHKLCRLNVAVGAVDEVVEAAVCSCFLGLHVSLPAGASEGVFRPGPGGPECHDDGALCHLGHREARGATKATDLPRNGGARPLGNEANSYLGFGGLDAVVPYGVGAYVASR